MKLKTLLKRSDWTEERLAAELRKYGLKTTRQSTINCIKNGTRNCGLQLALAIELATEGAVRVEELPLSKDSKRAMRQIRGMVWAGL